MEPVLPPPWSGQIAAFSRTDSQGKPFITENYPLQTFTSADSSLVATVAVDPQSLAPRQRRIGSPPYRQHGDGGAGGPNHPREWVGDARC
jgi:hypothetical protein